MSDETLIKDEERSMKEEVGRDEESGKDATVNQEIPPASVKKPAPKRKRTRAAPKDRKKAKSDVKTGGGPREEDDESKVENGDAEKEGKAKKQSWTKADWQMFFENVDLNIQPKCDRKELAAMLNRTPIALTRFIQRFKNRMIEAMMERYCGDCKITED